MVDVIDTLKTHARVLHRRAQAGDDAALARIRALPEATSLEPEAIQRRHCLTVVARELGFASWTQAQPALGGGPADDFGTLLYPDRSGAYWNIWSADYDEARRLREETGGYLLAYKKHFFIVETHFIESLGLDPSDPDWERIGRDWARPRDPEARSRLYARLVALRLPALTG